MASTNKTKSYQLNQWLGSDYMKRDDFNNDNELIDAALKYNADALSAEVAARAAGDNALRDLVSSEAAARQAADEEINSMIKSGVTMSPTIGLGMNSVIRKTDGITSFPKFTIQGKSYVNLLGKDGNCEDVGKWGLFQATSALDGMNKVFGANSIKITISSTFTQGLIHKVGIFDAAKYYFVSAYFKNGNATSAFIQKDVTGGGTYFKSSEIADTTKFVRVGMLLSPNQLNSGNYLHFVASGTAGQYVYVDGIMLQEITAAEYTNLSVAQLLEKYPYVDSYACLQNPYIEVRHDNLVRNGNGEEGISWWRSHPANYSTMSIDNGRFKIVTTGDAGHIQTIKVKPNTNYYIKANATVTVGSIQIYNKNLSSALRSGSGTFNTGANEEISIFTYVGTGTGYFDSIMLIEGTTAPASYKSCRIERCVIEGKFTSDDTVTYENGEVSGLLNWKHRTLYGKDYDWQYDADFTGMKRIKMPNPIDSLRDTYTPVGVKYDGKILKIGDTGLAYDMIWLTAFFGNQTYLSISDSDSGWTETLSPNDDEVKAFMNGWRAINNSGSRYLAWISVVDGSVPAGTISTTVGATYTSGSTTMTLTSVTGLAVGDYIIVDNGYLRSITSINGNVITLNTSISVGLTVNMRIMKCDNPAGGGTSLLTHCKNNVAPGYEGYQLHYKLANPEPITDVNVHVHGDIPKLDNGDNYLYVDSGMVIGEAVNPQLGNGTSSNTTYYINTNSYVNNVWGTPDTTLKNRFVENFIAIYKNKIFYVWNIGYSTVLEKLLLANTTQANYDTNATYTVDYQILKTTHTTPTAITMQYQQDVLSAVSDLSEGLNSRQKADSVLDGLVDLSVYEKVILTNGMICAWIQSATGVLYLQVNVPLAKKKVVPTISLQNLSIMTRDASVAINATTKFSLANVYYLGNGFLQLGWSTADATTISNIKTYGAYLGAGTILEIDCKGRL